MLFTEQYFNNIFNTAREALLVLDENLTVISANRSFFNSFKVDITNTIGRSLYDLGNGQWNIPALRALLEDILPKNTTVNDFEIGHHFESIGHKTMLLNACKIVAEKHMTILLAIEDITERRRLEDLLTESEERYRRLFETASDGIVLLEKTEGNITHTNPAVEKLLGYTKGEFIGNKLEDIGVPLDIGFQTMMQTLNNSGIMYFNDVPVTTKTGRNIDTDIYMVDRARLIQCNIRDITERKVSAEALRSQNEELVRLNKELESFIYSVSHDLHSSVRSIASFSKFLGEDYTDKLDEQGKGYLERIYQGTAKMSRLIEDILHVAQISRQEIAWTEVNMSVKVFAIVAELQAGSADRRVEVDIMEGLTGFADPGLIEIVLSNLIGNAWKFTSKTEKARIEFGAVEQNGQAVYYVRDNGAGFVQEYAGKIFWPFHRLHSEDEFEGTGIGLAIVERIIRGHGGKVWAEGEGGKGATVYFTLG